MTATTLIEHRYGKQKVRLLKVVREGKRHTVRELEVGVMLEGDFDSSYTGSDNRAVVATDSIKNSVYALAKDHLSGNIEHFGATLGKFFLDRYAQVRVADVFIVENPWNRVTVDGNLHSHTFTRSEEMKAFAQLVCSRDGTLVTSGIQDLVILKSNASGFEGFHRDEYTTLPETDDRILATSLTARWLFSHVPASYAHANGTILASMIKVFADEYSPSVQRTLYCMAQAALQACADIAEVHLSMPNRHCLLVDLKRIGIENKNEIFVPTEEPHGLIEATLRRG